MANTEYYTWDQMISNLTNSIEGLDEQALMDLAKLLMAPNTEWEYDSKRQVFMQSFEDD